MINRKGVLYKIGVILRQKREILNFTIEKIKASVKTLYEFVDLEQPEFLQNNKVIEERKIFEIRDDSSIGLYVNKKIDEDNKNDYLLINNVRRSVKDLDDKYNDTLIEKKTYRGNRNELVDIILDSGEFLKGHVFLEVGDTILEVKYANSTINIVNSHNFVGNGVTLLSIRKNQDSDIHYLILTAAIDSLLAIYFTRSLIGRDEQTTLNLLEQNLDVLVNMPLIKDGMSSTNYNIPDTFVTKHTEPIQENLEDYKRDNTQQLTSLESSLLDAKKLLEGKQDKAPLFKLARSLKEPLGTNSVPSTYLDDKGNHIDSFFNMKSYHKLDIGTTKTTSTLELMGIVPKNFDVLRTRKKPYPDELLPKENETPEQTKEREEKTAEYIKKLQDDPSLNDYQQNAHFDEAWRGDTEVIVEIFKRPTHDYYLQQVKEYYFSRIVLEESYIPEPEVERQKGFNLKNHKGEFYYLPEVLCSYLISAGAEVFKVITENKDITYETYPISFTDIDTELHPLIIQGEPFTEGDLIQLKELIKNGKIFKSSYIKAERKKTDDLYKETFYYSFNSDYPVWSKKFELHTIVYEDGLPEKDAQGNLLEKPFIVIPYEFRNTQTAKEPVENPKYAHEFYNNTLPLSVQGSVTESDVNSIVTEQIIQKVLPSVNLLDNRTQELDRGKEDAFVKKTAFNKDFGTGPGQVMEGNTKVGGGDEYSFTNNSNKTEWIRVAEFTDATGSATFLIQGALSGRHNNIYMSISETYGRHFDINVINNSIFFSPNYPPDHLLYNTGSILSARFVKKSTHDLPTFELLVLQKTKVIIKLIESINVKLSKTNQVFPIPTGWSTYEQPIGAKPVRSNIAARGRINFNGTINWKEISNFHIANFKSFRQEQDFNGIRHYTFHLTWLNRDVTNNVKYLLYTQVSDIAATTYTVGTSSATLNIWNINSVSTSASYEFVMYSVNPN